MRRRELGIGNMPFIAVLVLLIVAIALFVLKQDEASSWQEKHRQVFEQNQASFAKIQAGVNACNAWKEVSGLAVAELDANAEKFPTAETIKGTVRTWLEAQQQDIAQKSQAKVRARQYQIDKTNNDVKVTETGETATITLYGTHLVRDTLTFQGFIAPLGSQFAYAAKAIEANNNLFETEYKAYQARMDQFNTRINEMQGQYQTDVSQKSQLFDTEKQRADSMQDQVNQLTTRVDGLSSENQNLKTTFDREKRTLTRSLQAMEDALRNTKVKMEVALKEDPKDGEVLVADQRQGLVFINLGRNFKVAPDMKFMVWRLGKGNVREDIAEIRVIEVNDSRSTCRVLKWLNPRVPVSEGMSISNPFYDPHKKLRVFIFGNLRYYPSDLAKRRLAESGCSVSDRLDDTVNVIVLGEPEVELEIEGGSEEEAAAAMERAKVQRAARIREVMETAATLGAVVVAEDVLRTFIAY